MITLVNSNRLSPPIAPLGLDYIAAATRAAGIETDLLDLCLASDSHGAIEHYFSTHSPRLVGISFRNVDDSFWPSCQSYVAALIELVREVRRHSDAPIVIGGVGFSIFAERLTAMTGADFGVHGDGEVSMIALYRELEGQRNWTRVPGLCWQQGEQWVSNYPAWPELLDYPRPRDFIDNRQYYQRGGQGGLETKRGCPRRCSYCADPVAKGRRVRCRTPAAVADEATALWAQGVEVLHFCDGEFNIPRNHALAVCEALIERGLGTKIRFYIYAAVRPFDAELAQKLKAAGCVGINFTGDAAHPEMLLSYRAAHRRSHLEESVCICRHAGITCMVDLLLGGPGETPDTVNYTIRSLQAIAPDCVGAGLGMRVYPGTPALRELQLEGDINKCAGIKRRYRGPVDLVWPTFYISPALGSAPARMVRELIGADARFFAPAEEPEDSTSTDHNYGDNSRLSQAIVQGARGAYWDLLRER
jgi:tryptophan 2-C-methyltransferase